MWLWVLLSLALGYLFLFALLRVASRVSRREELIVHRKQSRVYQLDPTLVAQHAYHGKFRGGEEKVGEVPPPKDAA